MEVEEMDFRVEKSIFLDGQELGELKKFVHMENVEAEKLEWMTDINEKKVATHPAQFNAR
jgi:hypothetical protein